MGASIRGHHELTEILVRFLHGAQGEQEGFFRIVAGDELKAEGVILVKLAAKLRHRHPFPCAALDQRMGGRF